MSPFILATSKKYTLPWVDFGHHFYPSPHTSCRLFAHASFFTVTVYHIYSEHPGERPESNGRGDIWMEEEQQRQLDRGETCGVPALAGLCNPVRGKTLAAEWDLFMPDFENRRVHGWECLQLQQMELQRSSSLSSCKKSSVRKGRGWGPWGRKKKKKRHC